MKPGIRTTEFWMTLGMHVLTAVALVATATGHTFVAANWQPLLPAVALVASTIAQTVYTHSRSALKAAVAARTIPFVTVTAPGSVAVNASTSLADQVVATVAEQNPATPPIA